MQQRFVLAGASVPVCVYVCVCRGGIYLAGSSLSKERSGPSGLLIIALVWKQPKGEQQRQKVLYPRSWETVRKEYEPCYVKP